MSIDSYSESDYTDESQREIRKKGQSLSARKAADQKKAKAVKDRIRMLAVNKAKLKDDTVTFLRVNNYTGTFRQRAMMMMNQARKNFYLEEDQDGRVFKENRMQRGGKGKPQFDPLKVNPHRVQMFSINEIWHCVSRRLGELGVMHYPDEKSQQCIDSDSDQLDDDFDFREAIEHRIDSVFTGKNMGQVPLT